MVEISATLFTPSRTRKLAIIGHSLGQHNGYGAASECSTWDRGEMTWALALAGRDIIHDIWLDPTETRNTKLFNGANKAIGGDRTEQTVAMLDEIVNIGADCVYVCLGTNDANSLILYDTIISNVTTIVDRLLGSGVRDIGWQLITPRPTSGTGSWASASAQRALAQRVNDGIRALAREKPGLVAIEPRIVDKATADGTPLSGTIVLASDNTHLTTLGAYRTGSTTLLEWVKTLAPPACDWVTSPEDLFNATTQPYGVQSPNPFGQGTTGTAGTGVTTSSGIPTGWSSARLSGSACTAVATKEVTADGVGKQVLTITPSGSAAETFYVRPHNDLVTTLDPGDWIKAWCYVEISAYAGWTQFQLHLRELTTGTQVNGFRPYDSAVANGVADAIGFWVDTPALQIVGNDPTIRCRFEPGILGSVAGAPVVKVSKLGWRKIRDPRTLWGF